MTGEIKKLASETVLYGLGTILPRMLNFLLVPLHTAVFRPEDYGDISEFYGYVAFANIIFLFGMETALFRFGNKPEHSQKAVFRSAQTVVLAISTIAIAGLLLSSQRLSDVFSISNPRILIWIMLTIYIDAVVAIPFSQLRLQKRAVKFTILKISNIVLLVGLNLYFLRWSGDPNPGIELVFLSNFIANAVYLFFFYKELLGWRPLYDKKLTPAMLSYSYPLVLMGLAGMTNEMFSRIAIDKWLPKNFYSGKSPDYIQGVFAACYRFSVFMSLAVQAFRFASEPFFFSKASDKNSPELFAKVNHFFTVMACTVMIGICFNMEWLKYFIDASYWEGLNIVPVLLLGYIFLGIYYNISIWFKVTDRTHFGTIITFGGAAITILLNYWLIPEYGMMGSAVVTLSCYFSMTVACYFIGQKFYPVPYPVFKDLGIIIITCLLVLANDKIVIENYLLSITIRGLLSLLLLFIVLKLTFKKTVPS